MDWQRLPSVSKLLLVAAVVMACGGSKPAPVATPVPAAAPTTTTVDADAEPVVAGCVPRPAAPPAGVTVYPTNEAFVKANTKILAGTLEAWKLNHGTNEHCPTLQQLREANLLPPDLELHDAWCHRYRENSSGEDPTVWSAGLDGRWRTADDIWTGPAPFSQ